VLIEFDSDKRNATLKERELDMARADEILGGNQKTRQDDRKDYGEVRNITVGFLDGRMVVLVWTQRGAAVRVISLRRANAREQEAFYSGP
jgi:uncharacterized DUF497 family protein